MGTYLHRFNNTTERNNYITSPAFTLPFTSVHGNGISSYTSEAMEIRTGNFNGHDYVDLGLQSGTLWATMNVGATAATEHGGYYAWAETAEKTTYAINWSDYSFTNNGGSTFTKYNSTDNYMVLQPEDDAAHVIMGSSWCIPSKTQVEELCNLSTEWFSNYKGTGVAGIEFIGPNGNRLFFPAAGLKYNGEVHDEGYSVGVWSNTKYPDGDGKSWLLNCNSSEHRAVVNNNYCGFSVRGVVNPS